MIKNNSLRKGFPMYRPRPNDYVENFTGTAGTASTVYQDFYLNSTCRQDSRVQYYAEQMAMALGYDDVETAKAILNQLKEKTRELDDDFIFTSLRECKRQFILYEQKKRERNKPPTSKQTFGKRKERRFFSR